jgi:hypothetical protein
MASNLRVEYARDHGTVGNGVVDDTAALQRALDAVGSGVVYVTEGTYKVTAALSIGSHTYLRCEPNARFVRGAAIGMMLQTATSASGYAGDTGIIVEGGIWDANRTSQASACTVMAFSNATDVTVRDLRFVGGTAGPFVSLNGVQGARVTGCAISDHSTGGTATEAVRIALASDDTPCDDVLVTGNRFADTFSRGVGSATSAVGVYHTNIRVVGNTLDGAADIAIRAEQWQDARIDANAVTAAGKQGVLLVGCTQSEVRDNHVTGSGQATDATYAQIELATGSDGNLVTGNYVRLAGTNDAKYGVWVNGATCDTNQVTGNDLRGGGVTADLHDDGTGTVLDSAGGGVTSVFSRTGAVVAATNDYSFAQISGTAGATQGGTGLSSYSLGDLIYASATNTLAKLVGNTTTTKKFLTQTGTGSVSAAPAWDTLASGDLPTVPVSKGGSGLTATPTNGQLLIGNGSGFTLATLTAGSNITITNSAGGITIDATGGGGGGGAVALITETVVSVAAASVTFSSIAATYRDLRLVVRGRGSKSADWIELRIRLNGDTGLNYDSNWTINNASAFFDGDSLAQDQMFIGQLPGATAVANVAGCMEVMLPDYRGTTFHKTMHGMGAHKRQNSTGNQFNYNLSGVWRSTAAITSVTVLPDTGNFVVGTVVSLYGLS